VPPVKHSFYRCYGKRCLDVAIASTALLVLLPGLLVAALLVRIRLGRPVLFCQQRPGRSRQLMTVLKFRTMTDARDAHGELLPDEERLTPFGRFLRSSSIDELPQLWNVIRGDMSLVGPRPLLPRYLTLYTPEQDRRNDVRPGITGWAQVNGRFSGVDEGNAAAWNERLEKDLWYVDHCSLWLDLRILAITVVKVLRRSDVSIGGDAIRPGFNANADCPPETLTFPHSEADHRRAA
jgi:sugar transferase EpsL